MWHRPASHHGIEQAGAGLLQHVNFEHAISLVTRKAIPPRNNYLDGLRAAQSDSWLLAASSESVLMFTKVELDMPSVKVQFKEQCVVRHSSRSIESCILRRMLPYRNKMAVSVWDACALRKVTRLPFRWIHDLMVARQLLFLPRQLLKDCIPPQSSLLSEDKSTAIRCDEVMARSLKTNLRSVCISSLKEVNGAPRCSFIWDSDNVRGLLALGVFRPARRR